MNVYEHLSNYEHLATPVTKKGRWGIWWCKVRTSHDFECIGWAWFRCKDCGHEEGL